MFATSSYIFNKMMSYGHVTRTRPFLSLTPPPPKQKLSHHQFYAVACFTRCFFNILLVCIIFFYDFEAHYGHRDNLCQQVRPLGLIM